MGYDETKFNLNNSNYEPDADSRDNAVDILNVNKYLLQTESYLGEGGFDDGTYLIEHNREAWYNERRRISTYVNFVRPIVKAMVEPVFQEKPIRTYTKTKLSDAFIDDVTMSKISMNQFTEKCLTWLRLHSVLFVVVDNSEMSGAFDSEDEAVMLGARPYAYVRTPDKTCDDWIDVGKFGELNSIIFEERPEIVKDGYNLRKERRFRRWTKTESQLLKKNDSGEFEVLTSWSHNLGIVPVAVIHDGKPNDPQNILLTPKLRGVVRLNHSIYNKDSEIRDIERSQCFSLLCIQDDTGRDGKSVTIGSKNVMWVPTVAPNMPQFISPDMKVLEQLVANRDAIKRDLYDLAEQSGVIAVSKEAKSGLALSYEFRAYEETLKKSASLCEEIENSIINIFEAWIGYDIKYEVEYNKIFKPQRGIEDVKKYDLISMNPATSTITKKEISKNLHLIVDENAEQDVLDQIDEEMSQMETVNSKVEDEPTA